MADANDEQITSADIDEFLAEGRPWSAQAKFALEEARRELPDDADYSSPRLRYLLDASNLMAAKQSFEAGWIGQRMSWLVVSQSFLFSAFAAAATQHTVAVLVFLKWLVPIMGWVQAVATYISILAAGRIDNELYKTRSILDLGLRQYAPGMRQLPPLGNVRIGRAYHTRIMGSLSSRLIPVTLIVAWTLLIIALVCLHVFPQISHRWLLQP